VAGEQAGEEVAVVEPGGPAGKLPGTGGVSGPAAGGVSGPAAGDPRQETEAQRNDRNLSELIQELRVVSLGVQVLFGFLLSLPFTVRFSRLDTPQRDLYLASLVLSAVATTLLLGPVAYHRLAFRRAMKEDIVRYASLMASLGLAAVAGAVLVAVLLVTDVVAGPLPAALITAPVACLLVVIWYAMPFTRREQRGHDSKR
jgi:O-antigen/teichoic acid export membrane protein